MVPFEIYPSTIAENQQERPEAAVRKKERTNAMRLFVVLQQLAQVLGIPLPQA